MVINFNRQSDESLKKAIESLYITALDVTNNKTNISVNITFVGEKKIKELNNEYRNVNRVTDVLSFPLLQGDEFVEGEMIDKNITTDLGDIVICTKRAKQQAKDYGHSEFREFCFLALHGFLHLLGYDHMTIEDEKVMFNLQDKILKINNIGR